MENICRKCAPNTSPRHLFNFGKQLKTANACKKPSWKQDILKDVCQKTFKMITCCGQDYEKDRGLKLITSLSLNCKTALEISFD